MMERFRQGPGSRNNGQRRVDIGTGRLIAPSDTRSQGRGGRAQTMPGRVLALATFATLLIFVLTILSGCASQPAAPVAKNSIEIEALRLTAAGHYIDLRYRVLDAEHANQVLGPGVKPILIDEVSGAVMAVPMTAKLGSLRQTRGEQRPDRSYFVLFANTARLTAGSKVTAEIGDMKFENLTIE